MLRLACLLAVGTLLSACVAPGQVPPVDPRDDDEALLVAAVFDVLAAEGYGVVAVSKDGRRVETTWRAEASHRVRVLVRVSRTSMGLALALQAEQAVPVDQAPTVEEGGAIVRVVDKGAPPTAGEADPQDPVALAPAVVLDLDGVPHRVVTGAREVARQEEARLGQRIKARWHERRDAARRDRAAVSR